MPKTKFHAIDANGTKHTRSTARVYTHTVIAQYNKVVHMARATDKGWSKTDISNYNYYQEIIAGGRLSINHRATNPDRWNAEQIAEYQVWTDNANAEQLERATNNVGTMSLAEYLAAQLAQRIASVEATDYNEFHNMGWCGRRDLAVKLAGATSDYYHNVTILEAVAG